MQGTNEHLVAPRLPAKNAEVATNPVRARRSTLAD